MIQLLSSQWTAATYKHYHEALWHLAKDPTEWSLHFEETRRAMRKTEDLAADLVKSSQHLFETLGVIRASFPSSARLKDLLYQLSHFALPDINPPAFDGNAEQLEAWKVQTIQEGRDTMKEYGKRFEELVTYLEAEIDKEAG